MSSTHLLILHCGDHLMWYRHLVGQLVPLVEGVLPEPGYYWSREASGLLNIVHQTDAAPTPSGYAPARAQDLIQPGDLIAHIGGQHIWRAPTLQELGTSCQGHIVIRKATP
jgi:hypothetical protein